jgi:hypothetical protein
MEAELGGWARAAQKRRLAHGIVRHYRRIEGEQSAAGLLMNMVALHQFHREAARLLQ